jgi:predicted RNA-binding protein with PIN domain
MPLPYHLIDGYNLLHAAGLARASYGPGDLERARTALLLRVAEGLNDPERERTTVVFDAADPPPDAEHRFRFREIAVLFAVEGGEADALIEELIRRHPSPRQLRVVSDDIRLQKAAKRRGSQAVNSDAFLRRLKRQAEPTRSPGRASEDAGAGVGDWLEFFGIGKDGLVTGVAAEPIHPESVPKPANPSGSSAKPQPASGSSKPAAGGKRADPARREAASEKSEGTTGDELGFWQRRIDELLTDEQRRPKGS